MAQYATKKDLDSLEKNLAKTVDKAVDDLSLVIKDFAYEVDQRFNKVEAELVELNRKYDWLIKTLNRFLKRRDNIEANDAGRDAQIARHDRWLHQVAEKTDVKLTS